jgi:hypothetical protein
MTDTLTVNGNIRLNTYRILSDAIERGIQYGLQRAYKYTEETPPSGKQMVEIIDKVHHGIMCELDFIVNFGDE